MGKTASLANIGTIADSSLGFRNRLINGDMRIDQRNAGASVTPTNGQYTIDRWQASLSAASKYSVQQNAGSVTPPAGFSKYLGITSLSAYTVGTSEAFVIQQAIEGNNSADLAWGTASAATVTLSFWVRSSLTGTFGGALRNGAGNRSYPFTYTISASNTWEQKSVTIAGDTSGTWATDTSASIYIRIGLGVGSTYSGTAGSWASADYYSATGATSVVGTNGATFYITGVQLEKGSTATSFDYRPYTTELQLCQRYFWQLGPGQSYLQLGIFTWDSAVNTHCNKTFPSVMRATPTVVKSGSWSSSVGSPGSAVAVDAGSSSNGNYALFIGSGSGGTNGYSGYYRASNDSTAYINFSAEL